MVERPDHKSVNLVHSLIEPLYLMVQAICVVAIWVRFHGGDVSNVAVLVEDLRIGRISIRYRNRHCAPVRSDEPPQPVGIIPSAEVIESGFGIAFFASKLVM